MVIIIFCTIPSNGKKKWKNNLVRKRELLHARVTHILFDRPLIVYIYDSRPQMINEEK